MDYFYPKGSPDRHARIVKVAIRYMQRLAAGVRPFLCSKAGNKLKRRRKKCEAFGKSDWWAIKDPEAAKGYTI
ncbi:MAG: hypothetical protein WBO29_00325 [Albidovulum sp.]